MNNLEAKTDTSLEEVVVKHYTDLGILREKIHFSTQPSVCIWSLSRKCIVGEKDKPQAGELVKDGEYNRLSYDNNRSISMLMHEQKSVDVNKINNSFGIVVTGALYGRPDYRFGFIPEK